MFVAREAMKPIVEKLSSYAEHKAKPNITGISERLTRKLVGSFNKKLDMITVKTGAELLTVSANDTGTYHKAIRPSKRVENLQMDDYQKLNANRQTNLKEPTRSNPKEKFEYTTMERTSLARRVEVFCKSMPIGTFR